MKHYDVRKQTLLWLILATVLTISGLSLVYYQQYGGRRTTRYQDLNGSIYECSKPIKAVEVPPRGFEGNTYAPADQNEADKYCTFSGID